MNYTVNISQHAVTVIINIKQKSINTANYIIKELKDLKTLPWRYDSASNRYKIPVPNNIRIIPLKNYVGIYYIKGNKIKVVYVISRYKNIKEILTNLTDLF